MAVFMPKKSGQIRPLFLVGKIIKNVLEGLKEK